MGWRRNVPCGWGSGRCRGLGLGDGEDGFTIEQIRDRLRSRYPEAEPSAGSPGTRRPAAPGRPRCPLGRRDDGLPPPGRARSSSRRARRSRVGGPRRPRPARWRSRPTWPRPASSRSGCATPTATAGSWCSPSAQPDAARARTNCCGGSRWSGSRSTTCSSRPSARRPSELEIDWAVIEQADGADRSSQDWNNLMHLVARVAPKVTADLCGRKEHLLLVHPGLIARYDQMAVLETLRDKVGHDVPCPGLWVLGGDGRAARHADARQRRDPADHAGPAGQGVRSVGRQRPPGQRKAGRRRRRLRATGEAADHGQHQDAPAGTEGSGRRTGRGLARPCDGDAEIDAGLREAFTQIEKGAGPPRRSRSGGRTTSIRWPWRGCWPASSSGSWRTTT